MEEVFESGDTLINRIVRAYAMQVTLQLYKLIGSLDLLGNPSAVFADVGGGVRQFWQEKKVAPSTCLASHRPCLPLPALACPCLPLPALACFCLPLPALACPCLASPCLTSPRLALPCLTFPCLALPYPALPCLTLRSVR